MEDILYREVLISAGLFKNTQVQITLYTDHFEMEYSKPMSPKELWEIQRHISYVKKEIVYYNRITNYMRIEKKITDKVTGYQFFFMGDFETEKAGKRKNITNVSIQTMDRHLWDALDSYTPLVPTGERKAAEIKSLQGAVADPSVKKGTVEFAMDKRMIKTMRLFINDLEWKDYTYPPVRVSLPLGTYRIKIAAGTPDEDGDMNYSYTNEVEVLLDEIAPAAHLAVRKGFFSPSLEILS